MFRRVRSRAIEGVDGRPGRSDGGVVLLLTLLVMLAVGAIAAGLVLVSGVDVMASANVRDRLEVRASAEAVVELAIDALARVPDWSLVLNGSTGLFFAGGLTMPAVSGGAPVDAAALTLDAQRAAYGAAPWGADTPVWRLAGHGVPSVDLPVAGLSDRTYVLLWISDDVADGDGSASTDANDTVVVRGLALGARGARAAVQAVVGRTELVGAARRVAWRHVE